jgi:hypothetical protein
MPKRKPNAPGQGRPSIHGEPTATFTGRIPQSVLNVAKIIGPTVTMGLVAMAKQSKAYRDAMKESDRAEAKARADRWAERGGPMR